MPFGVSGPEQPPQQGDNIHGQDDFGKQVQHAEEVNKRHELPGDAGEMLPYIAVQRCVLHLLELRRNAVVIIQAHIPKPEEKSRPIVVTVDIIAAGFYANIDNRDKTSNQTSPSDHYQAIVFALLAFGDGQRNEEAEIGWKNDQTFDPEEG